MKNRLYDIDRAKGLAILLVVLGHLVARGEPPKDADWYLFLKLIIYKFHMAFFMFLSGVIFNYTYKDISNLIEYKKYACKKIKRLMPGFIIFAGVILFGKILASHILYVDNVNHNIPLAIIDIFIFPKKSVAGSLWYIYVLLEFYLIIPILLIVTDKTLPLLLCIGFFLYFSPSTDYFMLNNVFKYMIYFTLGLMASANYDLYKYFIKRYHFVFIALFGCSFLSMSFVSNEASDLIIGLCSIPALHGLVINKLLINSKILLTLGIYVYAIYLMNTITIGIAKALLFKFMSWDGLNFLFFFPVLFISGIVLPILIKKYIFKYSPYLSRITN